MANDPPVKYTRTLYSQTSPTVSHRWWEQDDKEIHAAVFAVTGFIQQAQASREAYNRRFARIYDNKDLLGLVYSAAVSDTLTPVPLSNIPSARLTTNVIKSCIDTAAAKISSKTPRVQYMTVKGSYSLRRKAQLRTQYGEALFDTLNVYEKTQEAFLHAEVFGTGCVKIHIDPLRKRLRVDPTYIGELVIDEVDAMYGEPRQLHQIKYYDRDVLEDQFPKFKAAIRSAPPAQGPNLSQTVANWVKVVESWHLRSSDDAKDDKHTICIDGATLYAGDYEEDYFPFEFFLWEKRLGGFFGSSLTEALLERQKELNKVDRVIQQAQHLCTNQKILVDVASNINLAHLTNGIPDVLKYQNVPPQFITPPALPPEVYQYRQTLIKDCYEITGVSQMSAQSRKDPDLKSGAAIREMQDIKSERFLLVEKRFERFHMRIMRQLMDRSKDLFEMDPSFLVKVTDNTGMQQVSFKDVDMKDDELHIRAYPVNLLPSEPAGKLDAIQDLVQLGVIQDRSEMLSLLQYPDLEKFASMQTSTQDNIERMIESMLEDGKYVAPEPFLPNPELAITMTQNTYFREKADGRPAARLSLLLQFMADLKALQVANAPPPQPAAPPGAQPAAAMPQ